MAKIRLGEHPKTFSPILVKFDMPDGTAGTIEATFNYKSRSEYAALIAEQSKPDAPLAEGAEAPPADERPFIVRHAETLVSMSSTLLLGALASWNLDEEVSEESLRQLSDQLPAAAQALIEAFASACLQGRVKN